LELQEIQESDFDLSLTGFDPGEIDNLLALDDEEKANATPPLPESPVSRPGDLWILGPHRVLCGDATSAEDVARLLGERKPRLLVTDPPYGIELDSEWRDRAGLNGHEPAEPSYMKTRTKGHTETAISGDTRADWSAAFELVPSLEAAYVWHASKFTREVLDGLMRIGFLELPPPLPVKQGKNRRALLQGLNLTPSCKGITGSNQRLTTKGHLAEKSPSFKFRSLRQEFGGGVDWLEKVPDIRLFPSRAMSRNCRYCNTVPLFFLCFTGQYVSQQ
jgi:hypothetical protein